MARLRVLMVGAGYRAQNSFLPVLRALQDRFEVVGIHARTAARLQPVADLWGIPAVARLDGPELEAADIVAISVPTDQNAAVLRQLLPHAARLSIMVDTPVASTLGELAALPPLLARFRRVAVAEDHMNFPGYALVRQAVAQGLIGQPKTLTLFHTGSVPHGLAIIRAFAGFQPVVRSWRRSVGTATAMVGYKFRGGFEGCIVKPYHRNQPDGGFIFEGTKGIVSQFPADLDNATPSRPVYLMRPGFTNGLLTSYGIEAGTKSLEVVPPELAAMRDMPFEDKSEHSLRRNCGMATIFRSLHQPDSDAETRLNAAYGADNALYDTFVSRLAEFHYMPLDPLTFVGRDLMSLLRPLSRLRH